MRLVHLAVAEQGVQAVPHRPVPDDAWGEHLVHAHDRSEPIPIRRVLYFLCVHPRGLHRPAAHGGAVGHLRHGTAVHLLHHQGVRRGRVHYHDDHATGLLAVHLAGAVRTHHRDGRMAEHSVCVRYTVLPHIQRRQGLIIILTNLFLDIDI